MSPGIFADCELVIEMKPPRFETLEDHEHGHDLTHAGRCHQGICVFLEIDLAGAGIHEDGKGRLAVEIGILILLRQQSGAGAPPGTPFEAKGPQFHWDSRVIAGILPKDVNIKVQQLDDLTDDQLMRKLAVLTEMAKPLLARLPGMIDVTPAPVEPHGNPILTAMNSGR